MPKSVNSPSDASQNAVAGPSVTIPTDDRGAAVKKIFRQLQIVTSTTAISVSGQQQQVNTPMSRQSHDGTNTTNASLMVVAAQNKTGHNM